MKIGNRSCQSFNGNLAWFFLLLARGWDRVLATGAFVDRGLEVFVEETLDSLHNFQQRASTDFIQ
jgi:hypothetical protein